MPRGPTKKSHQAHRGPTKGLTDQQARAVELRDRGLGWAEMGREMGVGRDHAMGAYRGGEKKLRVQKGDEALAVRLERESIAYMGELGEITDKGLSDDMRRLVALYVWHLGHNPEALARSSSKDVATIMGILVDKAQLLRGEPTQITRLQDVKKLDEVAEMLQAEMQRRGKIIDVTPEKV